MTTENENNWQVPAAVVAGLTGTSRNNVEKIRRGKRGKRNSRIARRVRATDRVLGAGLELLMQEVRMRQCGGMR